VLGFSTSERVYRNVPAMEYTLPDMRGSIQKKALQWQLWDWSNLPTHEM